MKSELLFYVRGKIYKELPLDSGKDSSLFLGSGGAHLDIYVPESVISRDHAQILVDEDGKVYVIDRESTNGTFVNGQKIGPGVPVHVQAGDEVYFSDRKIAQLKISRKSLKKSPPRDTQSFPSDKTVSEGSRSILERLRSKPELTVGRSENCDVVLAHDTVSRKHAVFRLAGDGTVTVRDLGSTNGTFLNGSRIHGVEKVRSGDTVIIGRLRLVLDEPPRELAGDIAIRTDRILKKFKNGHVGLQQTSISVPSGSLLAIMGPSGCGKSTLLKCLTGEGPASRGTVYLHNLELVQNYELLKTLIGYVPQDDIVHKELTVEQSLYFAAHLRMENPDRKYIDQKIDQVLQQLNISQIRKSRISKISGGQRKRVSIAVELLTDPMILFLDEPTSPLDPQTIEEFMKILQGLAKRGTTVVMVTHKPEDLVFMDSVIFMAEGGHLVYHGKADTYKSYFGVSTAVEVYASICGNMARKWIERFQKAHKESKHSQTGRDSRLQRGKGKSFFSQLYWLSRRYLTIKTNDSLNIGILIGQAPVIACLVLLIFDEVARPIPFLVTLSAIWFGTSNAAREIVGEAPIYRRERMFNLKIGPYIFSKLAVLSFFGAIQAIIFSGIIFVGFQGLDPAWSDFSLTALWTWGLIVCATFLGLMLSALVNSTEKVMTLVPLVLIPQVMLAGVVTPIKQPLVGFISYLIPTRWGNEGLVLIQGEISEKTVADQSVILNATDVLKGQFSDQYEDLFGELAYTLTLDVIMLSVLSAGMLMVLVWAMKKKDTISR